MTNNLHLSVGRIGMTQLRSASGHFSPYPYTRLALGGQPLHPGTAGPWQPTIALGCTALASRSAPRPEQPPIRRLAVSCAVSASVSALQALQVPVLLPGARQPTRHESLTPQTVVATRRAWPTAATRLTKPLRPCFAATLAAA